MLTCRLCSSLDFYLDILKATLRHNRYDSGLVITAIDNLGAMLNGYTSGRDGRISGNWRAFKNSRFATNQALHLPEDEMPHMEHVVPINVIWNELKQPSGSYVDLDILCTINKYLIPCLITEQQRVDLDSGPYKSNMAGKGKLSHRTVWSRYALTDTRLNDGSIVRLLTQVVKIPNPPAINPPTDNNCLGNNQCLMRHFRSSPCADLWSNDSFHWS